MISVVIFDFDGTLVDSNAIKRRAFFDLVAKHPGGRARMRRVIDSVCGDRAAILSAYVNDAKSDLTLRSLDCSALVRSYCDKVDRLVSLAQEMPGALNLLEQLRRRGRRVFLSSATPIADLRGILEQRNWLHLFEAIYGYPAVKRESAMQVLRRTGVEPDSLAIVGDGHDDCESAASVGCHFFPVGEARGASGTEKVFSLCELQRMLLGSAD